MSSCETFKKLKDILICHNQCDEFWSNFVHSCYAYVEFCFVVDSWRTGLPCLSTVAPPPPQPLQWASLLYVNTYQLRIYPSWLIRFQIQRILFMAQTGVERRLNINIKQNKTSRNCWPGSFSVAYCNAYSQTKVSDKNWIYPQKSMFTDTVGPTDMVMLSCSIL